MEKSITLEYKGKELEVHYEYEAEEAPVYYYNDGSGYPGCAEYINIFDVKYKGVSFLELLEDELEEITDCLKQEIK